jgi:hypothetical protein
MKVLFLDFDGVINNEQTFEELKQAEFTPTDSELQLIRKLIVQDPRHNESFWLNTIRSLDSKLIAHITSIIKATGAKVVISSAWRNTFSLQILELLLKHHGFTGEVIDSTPSKMSLHSRAGEIFMWLRNAKENKLNVENFVIIDDDSSPKNIEYLVDNLVVTDYSQGLDEAKTLQAIEILKRG